MKSVINDLRVRLSRMAFPRWNSKPGPLTDGYTILLPAPADLPVFIELALEVLENQNRSGLKEILVIPDWPCPKFRKYLENSLKARPSLPVRQVDINSRDKLAWRLTKSISTRHFTQLVRGVDETTTKFALIHDCDLFLPAGDFLLEQYSTCRDRNLNVYGLDMRRSQARSDREEFVATWEMTFSTEWFRKFPPHMHKGHVSIVNGKRQEFDTTLLPQYLTPAETIAWKDRSSEYVHFGYVIASYRNYTNRKRCHPAVFLKLFLIRLLVDVFDKSGWEYPGLPAHKEFLEGEGTLRQLLAELLKSSQGETLINEFEHKMNEIVTRRLFRDEKLQMIREKLDSFFGAIPGRKA